MLRGEALLERIKAMPGASKEELARACGYVGRRQDGMERVNFTAFYSALLDAKGIKFAGAGSGSGRRGRRISYKTKVHHSGNLMVGQRYLSMHDFQPGDRFEIKLSASQIQLVPIDQGGN